MRTTTAVEDEPLAAAKPADPPPAKRGRAKTKAQVQPAVAPGPAALAEAPAIDVTAVRMLSLDEGLYALRVGHIAGTPHAVSGMTLPVRPRRRALCGGRQWRRDRRLFSAARPLDRA